MTRELEKGKGSPLATLGLVVAIAASPPACANMSGNDASEEPEDRDSATVESVLAENVEIVGSCQVPAGARVCDLYFNTDVEAWTVEDAFEECRGVDTDDTWSDDFWHLGEMCPEGSLRSVCVLRYRAEFQYEWHFRDIEDSRRGCEVDNGIFYVFD